MLTEDEELEYLRLKKRKAMQAKNASAEDGEFRARFEREEFQDRYAKEQDSSSGPWLDYKPKLKEDQDFHGGQSNERITVQMPDGTLIENVPKGTTKAQLLEKLRRNGKDYGATTPRQAGSESAALAMGDAALSLGSGMVAGPAAGIAGLMSAPFMGSESGDVVRKVQDAMTYQPRTRGGQLFTKAVAYPFLKLSELGNFLGGGATDVSGSPAVGTAVDTAVQALPMALGYRVGRGIEKPPAFASGEVPLAVQERARGLAARAGLDWEGLPGEVRMQIQALAEDSKQAVSTDRVSLQRIAQGESLPVPIQMTKGQASRDPAQLRAEENLAQLDSGRAIRDRHVEQNQALIENLDRMRERTGPKSASAEQVGARVAGDKPRGDLTAPEGALAMAERKSKENVTALYQTASRSSEARNPVSPQPLLDWLDDNAAASASVPEINSLSQAIKKTTEGKSRPAFTMSEMEEIRKLAVQLDPNDGKAASHFMKEAKRVIDQSTAEAGGDLYKGARKARNEHALRFEEPQAIARLLDDKSRTDRKVALEDVWDSAVLRGSTADLQRVRDTLLNATDRQTRDAGRKAWRDIAGSTIEYIKDQATRSAATDSAGNLNVSPTGLKKALDRIGDKKLDMILGKSGADQIRKIAQVTADVKTLPPYKGGSTTVPNLLSTLDKVLGKAESVPIVGPLAGGAIRMGRAAYKAGTASKQADAALRNPLRQARTDQGQVSLRDLVTGPRVSPLIPLSDIGQFAEQQR